jgi:hypothetical protein
MGVLGFVGCILRAVTGIKERWTCGRNAKYKIQEQRSQCRSKSLKCESLFLGDLIVFY